MLELAVVIPVLAVMVLGVLDLGRAYRLQIRLDGAAREGAAHAVLHPNEVDCTGTDDILGHIAAADTDLGTGPGHDIVVLTQDGAGDLTVEVTGCNGTAVTKGDRVRIQISVTYAILTPMVARILGDSLVLRGGTEIEAIA